MLPHDPEGKMGPKIAQPDVIRVLEPKDEEPIPEPLKAEAPKAQEPPANSLPVQVQPH